MAEQGRQRRICSYLMRTSRFANSGDPIQVIHNLSTENLCEQCRHISNAHHSGEGQRGRRRGEGSRGREETLDERGSGAREEERVSRGMEERLRGEEQRGKRRGEG